MGGGRTWQVTLAAGLGVLLVVGMAAAGVAWKLGRDADIRADQEQASDREAAEESAAAEDARQAAADAKAEAEDEAERKQRRQLVKRLQQSVTKDARENVSEGILEGPIMYSTCDPLGGGSVDDLTAITGTFECLAIYEERPDGSMVGWTYSGTINYNEQTWSWKLGS